MIDIETLGVTPGSAIIAIGATVFSLPRNYDPANPISFYTTISKQSCLDVGLTTDSSTLAWWNKQDPVVRDEAFNGSTHIRTALERFSSYLNSIEMMSGYKVAVWGNGANFDITLLEAAYNKLMLPITWKYSNVRCYRTLKNLSPISETAFVGIKHHALCDAEFQASNAERMLTYITRGR